MSKLLSGSSQEIFTTPLHFWGYVIFTGFPLTAPVINNIVFIKVHFKLQIIYEISSYYFTNKSHNKQRRNVIQY